MSTLLLDLRFALRALLRRPGLTLAVALVLGLGLGTVTAVFSVVDRALLRPLASEGDPDRWVHVALGRPDGSIAQNLSYPLFEDLQSRTSVFDAFVAHSATNLTLSEGGEVERLDAAGVSSGFFRALGVTLPLGRDIAEADDRAGAAERVVVLSQGLWQRRFGGSPEVLGRSVQLNGSPFTIIGVAPPDFLGPVRGVAEDAWIPITATTNAGSDAFQRRTVSWLDVLARVAPGIRRDGATSAVEVLSSQLVSDSLLPAGTRLTLEDGAGGFTGFVGNLRQPLMLLFVGSLLVLAIAGANLASLLLARASTRHRELAIRLSLGATRGRLVRLFLIEACLLTLGGAVLGMLVASWLVATAPILRTFGGTPLMLAGGVDYRAMVFLLGAAALLAAAIAAGPALWSSTLSLIPGLRAGATDAPGEHRLRGRLVVLQLALAVILVAGGFLFALTTRRLAEVNPGYDPRAILLASVDLDARGSGATQAGAFWQAVSDRLAQSALVESASVAQTITPQPGGMRWDQVPLEGSDARLEEVEFDVNLVGPGYFATLRIPVLEGRGFEPGDRAGAEAVAVVNRTMARHYWGDASPIGRRVWMSGDTTAAGTRIIGVVADGKYRSLREAPTSMLFLSALQTPPVTGTLLVRAHPGLDPQTLVPAIREAVRGVDPAVPVFDVRPLSEHLGLATATERLLTFLSLLYAGLATVLAAVGLFGLLSFLVQLRTREIGIRLALGAEPARVRREFMGEGLRRAGLGVVIGLLASAGLGRWIQGLLYGVSPVDPRLQAAVALLLLGVALLASWGPASRASRVDPIAALRSD